MRRIESIRGLWPVGIFEDRYGGVYSGGAWIAMGRCDRVNSRNAVFEGCNAGDLEAAEFWTDERKALTGRGSSPNEALADLNAKATALGNEWWGRWSRLDEWD